MDRIHCNLWDKKGASPSWVDAPQSADKAYNRKNRSDILKIRGDFCFLQVDLPSPSGSTNPVALGDKFCRRQNFLVSCTCILLSLTSM